MTFAVRAPAAILLFIGCGQAPERRPTPAAPAARRAPGRCLTDAEVERQVKQREAVIDVVEDGAETSLVESRCLTRVYRRGSYLIVVALDPVSGTIATDSYQRRTGERGASVMCLERASARLGDLLPGGEELVARARRRYGRRWPDPARGPRKWVRCEGDDVPDPRSLDTLAHELNHQLRRGQCLYEPTTAEMRCFSLSPRLPPRSLARLDPLPDFSELGRAVQIVQDTYLGAADQGPLLLFDELLSYRIDMQVQTALLERGELDGDRRRTLMNMPQLALYAVRYLAALEARDPDLYRESFGPDSPNRRVLFELFDSAAAAHRAWSASLARAGRAKFAPEIILWDLFREGVEALRGRAGSDRRRPKSPRPA